VLCSTGEGATSEGEWHEAINFSAVHKLPIVFLVQNNGWAISTPQSKQMAIVDVADKASGYGLPGLICDGTDPIATYRAMKVAMDRARGGGGPTLVEAKCYRLLAHSTDDDDRVYRDRDEVAHQRADDPVPKYERVLLEAGLIDDESLAKMKADVLRLANDATDDAEALPYPSVDDMTTHLYAGAAYEPWLE
jgi:2-oxoisovalerate dehydrogenase E1 component alpha subunit